MSSVDSVDSSSVGSVGSVSDEMVWIDDEEWASYSALIYVAAESLTLGNLVYL